MSENDKIQAKHLHFPLIVICISGKRKSGKDFIAQQLIDRLEKCQAQLVTDDKKVVQIPLRCTCISVAGPIKKLYAQKYGLDYSKLLDSSPYKETVRRGMVDYSDEVRVHDLDFFVRYSISEHDPERKTPIWILTDARRREDIEFFTRSEYVPVRMLLKIRVEANMQTRQSRNFQFTHGIDDYHTETGLDSYAGWDYIIQNDAENEEKVIRQLDDISARIFEACNS